MDVSFDFAPVPVPFSELRIHPCSIPLEANPGEQQDDPRGPIRLVMKRPIDLPLPAFRPLPRTPCKDLKVRKKKNKQRLSSPPPARPSTPPPDDNALVLPTTPGKEWFPDVPDVLPPPTPFHRFGTTAGTSLWELPSLNYYSFSYDAIKEAFKIPAPISPLPKTPRKRREATWLLAPSAKRVRSDA